MCAHANDKQRWQRRWKHSGDEPFCLSSFAICLHLRDPKVKSLSLDRWFVIALHSPGGVAEIGLPIRPSEKKARNLALCSPCSSYLRSKGIRITLFSRPPGRRRSPGQLAVGAGLLTFFVPLPLLSEIGRLGRRTALGDESDYNQFVPQIRTCLMPGCYFVPFGAGLLWSEVAAFAAIAPPPRVERLRVPPCKRGFAGLAFGVGS